MSIVHTLTHGAAYAVRHPARTALNVVGVAKGTVSAGLQLTTALRHGSDSGVGHPAQDPGQTSASSATVVGETAAAGPAASPERVMVPPGERHAAELEDLVEVDQDVPGDDLGAPGEVYAHEATASARGAGQADDERVDAWAEDAEDAEHGGPVTAAEGIAQVAEASDVDLEAPLPDEPLLDPSVAKSVASEAETMRRAAE